MWSYIKLFKYYFVAIIEIAHVIVQSINQYIFSTTEKNIRNEVVLITGSGRGLGIANYVLFIKLFFSYALRSTNGSFIC
jgi:hypothetical protein